MAKSIDDIINQLEEQEKTADEMFTESLTSGEKTNEEPENSGESQPAGESSGEEEEKTAETEGNKSEEEKTAETANSGEASNSQDDFEKQLAKYAADMGKVAAHNFFQELVAMGVMPATNDDTPVPPISQVSQPSQSPVTVAADAQHQMSKGTSEGGPAEKTASVNMENVVRNLYNKYNQ